MPKPTNDLTKEIMAYSRKMYCKPRAEVEKQLSKWDEAGDFGDDNAAPAEEVPFEEPII